MLLPRPDSASDSFSPSKITPSNACFSDEDTERDMLDASRPASFILPWTLSSSRRNVLATLSSPERLPSRPANWASRPVRSAS